MNSLLAERLLAARIRGRSVVDDGDVALVIEYIGSQASGKVTVESSGDLTLVHGAVGAEAADTTVGAPTLNGTIDVSDTTANNFGLVVDAINSSANWRAYLVDVLRADSSNASTGSILAAAAAQAKVAGGLVLYKDTSKVLNLSLAIKYAFSTADTDASKNSGVVSFAKENGKFSEVLQIVSNSTFGSGTSLVKIYRVNRLTGASVLVYTRAGGATTVDQALDLSDGAGRGLACNPDEYLLVRLVGSAAITGFFNVAGKVI